MEIFVVYSLLELRQLRHLFRAFPDVLFTGGYVSIRVEVHGIDRVKHALCIKRILGNFAEEYNCEVSDQKRITDVAYLANALLFLKEMADEATSNIRDFDERICQMLGHGALIVRESSAFATGRFEDMLFSIVKRAVSCANTGLELLSQDNMSIDRWERLICRIDKLEADVAMLLKSPVLL